MFCPWQVNSWQEKGKKKRITTRGGKVMRYAFIRKQVYYEELKHESNSAAMIKAFIMPTFYNRKK
jgi:hypothetical protein